MAIMRKKAEVKKWHLLLVAAIIILSFGGRIYAAWWSKGIVSIGGQEVKVLIADTDKHRFRGWSNEKNMGKYGGMLFVYPTAGQHAMVMRDMNFPLDMIWINGNEIVDMAPNLQPEPGRAEAQLTVYFARLPSNLVMELPAGFIEKNRLKIGDIVEVLQ